MPFKCHKKEKRQKTPEQEFKRACKYAFGLTFVHRRNHQWKEERTENSHLVQRIFQRIAQPVRLGRTLYQVIFERRKIVFHLPPHVRGENNQRRDYRYVKIFVLKQFQIGQNDKKQHQYSVILAVHHKGREQSYKHGCQDAAAIEELLVRQKEKSCEKQQRRVRNYYKTVHAQHRDREV